MEFDSPEKEFPGLYMGDAGKTLADPAVYEEDEKAKKKKEKKDSKKEKGYAALLAGESSHEEDELDPKSPGKTKKIKASFKLSAKKKDKKSVEKTDKERRNSSDKKPVEKEKEEKKKVEKEKDKKVDKKKKSLTGDILSVSVVPGSSLAAGTSSTSPNTPLEKEKGLNLNMALNAFKNAPAPLLMKKDKDVKKDKEGSTSSKVSSKLKLKRSKNSLESDSQASQLSDIPVMVCHQFPEDPEAIVKEIKKYESLLEQTHSHMKSSKKVSKKSEEQLWELQRTLTQLKRKLRSINALSVGSVSITNTAVVNPVTNPVNKDSTATVTVPVALLPQKPPDLQQPNPSGQPSKNLVTNSKNGEELSKEITKPAATTTTTEILATGGNSDEDMKLDFTLRIATVDTMTADVSVNNNNSAPDTAIPSTLSNDSTRQVPVEDELANENTATVPNQETESFSPTTTTLPHTLRDGESEIPLVVGNNNSHSKNQRRSSNLNTAINTTPEPQIERVQVEVQVHQQASPSVLDVNNTTENVSSQDETVVVTPEMQMDSTQLASIIKTLTFSDEEDDDNEEVTDVSCLSLVRNNYAENGISSTDTCDGLSRTPARNGEMDPFEMAVFETEDYLPIENEALIFFNEELQEEITKSEQDIENLMEQLIQMRNNGVDIDAPEIGLDLDQFDNDDMIISLWQITKLENEALNEHVNHLRKMVAVAKLETFLLETRLKYLEDVHLQKNCVNPVAVVMNNAANSEENGAK